MTAPFKFHRLVGMVKVCNRILQAILNKATHTPGLWDEGLMGVLRSMNDRRMRSLGCSSSEILLRVSVRDILATHHPALKSHAIRTALLNGTCPIPSGLVYADLVVSHMANREMLRERVVDAGFLMAAARRERH